MLQAGSDLVVGGPGAYMMGGPVRGGAPKTNRMGGIHEIETTAKKHCSS